MLSSLFLSFPFNYIVSLISEFKIQKWVYFCLFFLPGREGEGSVGWHWYKLVKQVFFPEFEHFLEQEGGKSQQN